MDKIIVLRQLWSNSGEIIQGFVHLCEILVFFVFFGSSAVEHCVRIITGLTKSLFDRPKSTNSQPAPVRIEVVLQQPPIATEFSEGQPLPRLDPAAELRGVSKMLNRRPSPETNRRRAPRYTQATVLLALLLLDHGYMPTEVAQIIGVSASTVYRWKRGFEMIKERQILD
jgi:hypothetical protein